MIPVFFICVKLICVNNLHFRLFEHKNSVSSGWKIFEVKIKLLPTEIFVGTNSNNNWVYQCK